MTTTTEYAILLPDESNWQKADAATVARTYEQHTAFINALAERGHRLVAGAELQHSKVGRTVRIGPEGGVGVTDGPYAESAEQISGFYLVASNDLDDLTKCCELLASVTEAVEIRPTVARD